MSFRTHWKAPGYGALAFFVLVVVGVLGTAYAFVEAVSIARNAMLKVKQHYQQSPQHLYEEGET